MIGQNLAHYRITAALGAGGMGEVWRATDEKLGREVALKVLSEEFASDPHRLDRFEREARAVAALNHPHIVTIHSVEEAEGIRFLTMELVDGQTLDALIPKDGLEIEPFFDFATPLAEAVSAAHDKSVIHRDLKPSNVMVDRDGRVKVMDFGLAKLQEAGEVSDSSELPTEALTGIGMVVGTVPYMSPEQIEGEIVDHRTDIFSLGVLLYEMAIGERPFQGKSSPALMSSILKDVPKPVVELRSDLPRHLGRIIGRCLEKDRRNRYQTARDVFNELKALRRESPALTGATARSHPEIESSTTARTPPSSEALGTAGASSVSGTIREDEGFWVAVLPFKYTGGDADLVALAEGLSEDIGTGLSRFSYLRVIAQGSKVVDARYHLEGSIRQAGAQLRLAVQLVDTTTGAHLWAKTYDRTFSPQSMFELQDDLVPRIVSTVADMHGILPRQMSETVRLKPADQLTPYESLLHSFGYNERFTPDALVEARTCLERAVEQAPGNADCWAMLSLMYSNEYGHYDIRDPDTFDKALEAARKAVLVGPLHTLPHYALAQAHFFRREFPAARTAAERAVSLNPMDGATAAFMGLLIAYSGNWERGCGLAERAWELNPNLPGMYHYTAWHDAYRREDYHRALELALKLNTPESFYQHAVLTMCYAQLGEMDEAHKSLQDMLALKPDYGQVARQLHGKWIQPDLVEKLIDGLRKAGLEIAEEEEQSDAWPVQHASNGQPADEGFWVAVLPFDYTGGDPDITALAEGLSADIVTGLSRFSYLRVISRGSTLRYAGEGVDTRTVGAELGARYVMEGTLRQAGNTLRVAVQLVDATTGAHLWAENYERTLDAETIFEVQDDLVPKIVSTVADWYGALPHSMSEAVRLKPSDQLSSYEAVLRSFGYFGRISPQEHAIVRSGLERAVEQSPGDAYGWAMLSMMYGEEHRFGFNVQTDPLDRSVDAARRAVDAAPTNNIAWLALAQALFFRKEFDAFYDAAERAIALNSMDGSTHEYVGHLMAFAGGWERGCEVSERARQLNPNHPGWYWVVHFLDAYRKGDYQVARDYMLKAHHRGGGANFFQLTLLASLYGQLGEQETAEQTLHKVLSQQPEIALFVREEFGKWYLPELVEQLMDGLRMAGLEIADEKEEPEVVPVHSESGEQPADEGFWVAVLPFKSSGGDKDLDELADGLSEDIVTGLSRFSYLRVIALGSATTDARFLIEGSLRRAGKKLRVAVKLVDTVSGDHLWAEAYDRDFEPDDLFALQDDLVPRIVSTCADHFGVLARAISEAVRNKPLAEMTPYEALMRGFGYHFRLSPNEHAKAREALEKAVEMDPANADCQAMLAWVYAHEVAHGFNPRPGSLDRALAAARTAVDLAPSNHLAQQVLAAVLFFRGETAACRSACERALALNPLDGSNEAIFLTCFTGDWEKGCGLVRRAMELNPHHPRWYGAVLALDEYRRKNYRGAVDSAIEANAVDLFWTHWLLAAAYGQLGEQQAARGALDDLLALKPDFVHTGRQILKLWFQPELVEHFVEGLRKAGLEVPALAPTVPEAPASGTAAVSIAVLPFSDMSPAKDQEYLCEGMAEEIMNSLSRLEGLRVIARTSAFRFRGEQDLRKVGEALGVGVVLEGSVRRAGQRLRITAQLVDIAEDSHIWSERFEREMTDVFEIQDEIASAIVDKLHLSLGLAGPARRPTTNVKAYEALLEARHFFFQFTPEAAERALACLQQALSLEPDYPDALVEYAFYHLMMAYMFADPRVELAESRGLAERALKLDPDHGEAQAGVAVMSVVLDWDWLAGERHFRRALELAPASARVHELFGLCNLLGRGRFDEALAELDRAVELDPLSALYAGNRGRVLTCARRFAEAEETCRRGLALDPGQLLAQVELIYALTFQHRFDEAVVIGRRAVESHGGTKAVLNALAVSLALAGEQEEAWSLLNDDGETGGAPYRSPLTPGLVHAVCCEMDAAFECVGQAIDEKDPMLMYLQVHPMFDALRDDPRYPDLLRRVNLIEEGQQ